MLPIPGMYWLCRNKKKKHNHLKISVAEGGEVILKYYLGKFKEIRFYYVYKARGARSKAGVFRGGVATHNELIKKSTHLVQWLGAAE